MLGVGPVVFAVVKHRTKKCSNYQSIVRTTLGSTNLARVLLPIQALFYFIEHIGNQVSNEYTVPTRPEG